MRPRIRILPRRFAATRASPRKTCMSLCATKSTQHRTAARQTQGSRHTHPPLQRSRYSSSLSRRKSVSESRNTVQAVTGRRGTPFRLSCYRRSRCRRPLSHGRDSTQIASQVPRRLFGQALRPVARTTKEASAIKPDVAIDVLFFCKQLRNLPRSK